MSDRPDEPGMDLLGALAAGRLDPATGARRGGEAGADESAGDGPGGLVCSRRGCTADAAWALEWNNPRVHAPERVKTWLACEPHRPFLDDFLSARGFLRRAAPLPTPHTPQEPPRP